MLRSDIVEQQEIINEDTRQEIEFVSSTLSESDMRSLDNLENQIQDAQIVDNKNIKRLLRYVRDNDIKKAASLWKKHKELAEVFNWNNAISLGLNEENLRRFFDIACKRRFFPVIERLFTPEKLIVGTDEEKIKVFEIILSTHCQDVIQKLDIKVYLALHTTNEEKIKAYKAILSSRCLEVMKQLDIKVFIGWHVTIEEKKQAYIDILSSQYITAIKQLDIRAYIDCHVTDEEKKQAYKDVLASQCVVAIKQLDITAYMALHATDKAKRQAYKAILSSQCSDAIRQLDIKAYLALYATDDEKVEAIKNVFSSGIVLAIQQTKDLILDWQENNPDQFVKLEKLINKNKRSQKTLFKILSQSREADLAEIVDDIPYPAGEPPSKRQKSNPEVQTEAPKMTLFSFLEKRNWQEKQESQCENLKAHPFIIVDKDKIPRTKHRILPIRGVPAVFFKPVELNIRLATKRKYGLSK